MHLFIKRCMCCTSIVYLCLETKFIVYFKVAGLISHFKMCWYSSTSVNKHALCK
jgi:hypothetical protein